MIFASDAGATSGRLAFAQLGAAAIRPLAARGAAEA
jgi:hypothetical protein